MTDANYYVRKHRDRFAVKEHATDFIIRWFEDHKNASTLAKKLNAGFGFAGETPTFFIKKEEQVVFDYE